MARNHNQVSSRVVFGWLMLAGLILFFAPERWTSSLQLSFVSVLHRPLIVARDFSLFLRKAEATEDSVPRTKYVRLRNRLANTAQWLDQERQKVEQLSGLCDRTVWQGVHFVIADVVTSAIDASQGKVVINRGRNDGLKVGQFVLGNDSLIGTIAGASSRTAQVNLVTDPASKIAVNIRRGARSENSNASRPLSNPAMMMQGAGNNLARIDLLPAERRVGVGSVVFTAKNPGLLGAPIIVGTVHRCERDTKNPLLWDVTVEPACDIEKLSEVAIIVMNPRD